jgi:hypothetical protein
LTLRARCNCPNVAGILVVPYGQLSVKSGKLLKIAAPRKEDRYEGRKHNRARLDR